MIKGTEHIFKGSPQAIAITAIARQGNSIFCGLTSGPETLAKFDIKEKRFTQSYNVFPWANDTEQIVLRKIHNSMGTLSDGRILIGEGILYTWDGIPFNLREEHNTEPLQQRREKCGMPRMDMHLVSPSDMSSFDLRWLTGGKILIFDPVTGTTEEVCQVPPMTYVQSMVIDADNNKAYGHTLGACHFFEIFIDEKRIIDHGRISTWAFHNMVIKNGIVYGAWIDNEIKEKLRVLRFDPAKGYLERLPNIFLDDPGPRVQGNRGIDQWIVHSSGDIYVGTAGGGVLYRFDEVELTFEEIGHVGEGGRVTSLDEDEQGRIIFTAGFPKMSVGRYNPKTKEIENFGPITDKYDKIYFHGSVYKDGTLYLAETDSGVASLWEVPMP